MWINSIFSNQLSQTDFRHFREPDEAIAELLFPETTGDEEKSQKTVRFQL